MKLMLFFIMMFFILILKKKTYMIFKNYKKMINMNHLNSIECGFNLINIKKSININFINNIMIFIMFDLEMIIIMPMIFNKNFNKINLLMLLFMLFIYLSIILEIKNKKINW